MAAVANPKEHTEQFWENKPVKTMAQSREKYDVIISFSILNTRILALHHLLGSPSIMFNPGGASSLINKNVANLYFSYSTNLQIGMSSSHSLFCKIAIFDDGCFIPVQDEVARIYLQTSPAILQLKNDFSLVLVYSHTSAELARPYVPNMVQIGGFYAQTTNKLPDNLQKYLDSAKDGAVLFSFGTNMKIKDMEKDKLNAILEGLRKISPMKALFKSEIELKDAPKNVFVSKWLPQNDILAHPNIKAFITHGGLGSNTEAVYHGVPMVGIPLFADQQTNIDNAVKAGYAVRIFYEDLSQETIDEALKEILKNPSYTKMAKKRSSLLRNQPMNPMDKAIWWVEHIIEHKGGEHLRNLGMDLTWYQLYMVDIMLFYLVVILIMFSISILMLRWVIRKIFCRTNQKKTKKD